MNDINSAAIFTKVTVPIDCDSYCMLFERSTYTFVITNESQIQDWCIKERKRERESGCRVVVGFPFEIEQKR